MKNDNLVEKLSQEVAEQCSKCHDEGFIAGFKWLGSFIILEMEYQNLHEMAQKLKVFIASKEREIKKELL